MTEPVPPGIITGKRSRQPTKRIQEALRQAGDRNRELRHIVGSLAQVTSEIESDPLSVAEAMRRPDWAKWLEAMNDEITRLQQRGTYIIVTPPPDANILTSKWVYRTKKDEHGRITGHRARLVV